MVTENFTQVPNKLIEAKDLDCYDKMVMIYLTRLNPSFPSYPKIMKAVGISRDKLWKSLKRLEMTGWLRRRGAKKGRIEYYPSWDILDKSDPKYMRFETTPVRHTDYTSPSHGLDLVRHTDCNNTKNKTNLIIEGKFTNLLKSIPEGSSK